MNSFLLNPEMLNSVLRQTVDTLTVRVTHLEALVQHLLLSMVYPVEPMVHTAHPLVPGPPASAPTHPVGVPADQSKVGSTARLTDPKTGKVVHTQIRDCIRCGRRFVHNVHLSCNSCDRRTRAEKRRATKRSEKIGSEDESSARNSPLLMAEKPVPERKVVPKPAPSDIDSSPEVKSKQPKREGKKATKLEPPGSADGPAPRKGVTGPLSGGSDVETPIPKKKVPWKPAPGYMETPARFMFEPRSPEHILLLKEEWRQYRNREFSYDKAMNMRKSIEGRDSVLQQSSGNSYKPYSKQAAVTLDMSAVKYLQSNPEHQPWILRLPPQRADFDLPIEKWTKPKWINVREPCNISETLAKSKVARNKRRTEKKAGEKLASGGGSDSETATESSIVSKPIEKAVSPPVPGKIVDTRRKAERPKQEMKEPVGGDGPWSHLPREKLDASWDKILDQWLESGKTKVNIKLASGIFAEMKKRVNLPKEKGYWKIMTQQAQSLGVLPPT